MLHKSRNKDLQHKNDNSQGRKHRSANIGFLHLMIKPIIHWQGQSAMPRTPPRPPRIGNKVMNWWKEGSTTYRTLHYPAHRAQRTAQHSTHRRTSRMNQRRSLNPRTPAPVRSLMCNAANDPPHVVFLDLASMERYLTHNSILTT